MTRPGWSTCGPRAGERWYRGRSQPLAEVEALLESYGAHWSDHLDALERHLEQNP